LAPAFSLLEGRLKGPVIGETHQQGECVVPIQTALWKVGAKPEQLIESSLPKERDLEEMIVAAPRMLSDPKWRSTVERLKERFPNYDSDAQS
jgi:hypothetical protein